MANTGNSNDAKAQRGWIQSDSTPQANRTAKNTAGRQSVGFLGCRPEGAGALEFRRPGVISQPGGGRSGSASIGAPAGTPGSAVGRRSIGFMLLRPAAPPPQAAAIAAGLASIGRQAG